MNIFKYIQLIAILVFLPIGLSGQVGRKSIILSTGDTVKVVNQQSFLTKQDKEFLRKDTLSKNKILNLKSDYNSIEEAAIELERLMGEISTSKSLSEKNNESLSVRIATRNLRNIKKEQDLQSTWDSIIASEPPMEELVELYKLFDGKPSYFINGILVKNETITRLRPNEILSRTIRTLDTATGNPNGEIWYEVIPQTLQRLNIKEENLPEFSKEEEKVVIDNVLPTKRLQISEKEESTKTKQDNNQNSDKKRSVRKIKERQSQK